MSLLKPHEENRIKDFLDGDFRSSGDGWRVSEVEGTAKIRKMYMASRSFLTEPDKIEHMGEGFQMNWWNL